MKADVFPATALPRLYVPSWVPDVITHSVSARYAADVAWVYRETFRESGYFGLDHFGLDRADKLPDGYLDALIRDDVALRESVADLARDDLAEITDRYLPLTCDGRMEGVWRELSKHGSNGGFFYPAIGIGQDAAMLALFDTAFACQQRRGATTTRRQAEPERDRWLTKATQLRDDARILMASSPLDLCLQRNRKLEDAARVCEDYARELYAASLGEMALERSHDGRARWVALTIGNTFNKLFGSPMYGLTTTITSVVLGREIELRTVRQWLISGSKTTA